MHPKKETRAGQNQEVAAKNEMMWLGRSCGGMGSRGGGVGWRCRRSATPRAFSCCEGLSKVRLAEPQGGFNAGISSIRG